MMASKFILQQALSLAAPLTLLPLPLSSFFNVTLEVISGESIGEQGGGSGGTAGSQADQQPILFVLLLLALPLPVTRKILFRLTFTTGPKGESLPLFLFLFLWPSLLA